MKARLGRRVALVATLLLLITVAVPALAEVIQRGGLRVSVTAQLKPYKLPRTGSAPIDVFIAGHIDSTDGKTPPQLRRMEVLLHRNGVIDTRGLPRCRLQQISPSTYQEALQRCGRSLVGAGHFWASIVLPDQPSYPTTGRLLVFNGVHQGRPAVFAHIYTAIPFPSSFVVTFAIRKVDEGPYGTRFTASLPQALGDWGFVDRIKMTLGRAVQGAGQSRSYINAGCPAPAGTRAAVFPLARATLDFAGNRTMRATVTRPCGVRE
jgi:hypothetical protein